MLERESAKPMLSVLRVNHENASVHYRGLGQERIAQPLLPDDLAAGCLHHFQGATLGVEDDQAVRDHGCSGAVVRSSKMPHLGARTRVEGVKIIAAEASADEDAITGGRRRRNRALLFQCDSPAGKAGRAVSECGRTLRLPRSSKLLKKVSHKFLSFASLLIQVYAFKTVPAIRPTRLVSVLISQTFRYRPLPIQQRSSMRFTSNS